jgi:hypothetical protein
MRVHKGIRLVGLSLILAVSSFVGNAGPVVAGSYQFVQNPPCTPSGVYRPVSKGSSPGQDAYLQECSHGGYWYVRPLCRIQAGDSDDTIPWLSPGVIFEECNVFVWNGGTYVTRYGFEDLEVYPVSPDYSWTAYWMPGGTLKISGYSVSSEMCGFSSYWNRPPSGYIPVYIGCAQSSAGALGT